MVFPLQVGDFITLSRLAWEVYNLGWSKELDAERQYREFFQDVKFLGGHLNVLDTIVKSTDLSLRTRHPSLPVTVPLDRHSLREIVGDYDATLEECRDLIQENQQYAFGSNAKKNIAWNILVQPRANRLRERIAMHHQKVSLVLQPFYIDLLSRVQRDVGCVLEELQRMRNEVINRLDALRDGMEQIHTGVLRVLEAMELEVGQPLGPQPNNSDFLEIPPDVRERFDTSAESDPSKQNETGYQLEKLDDALVGTFRKLMSDLEPGMAVVQRILPVESYINLLKCVWILEKMREAPRVQDTGGNSHWPSYVSYLIEKVSTECKRVQTEKLAPDVSDLDSTGISQNAFRIWPDEEQTPLLPIVIRDEDLLQLSEVPLQVSEEHRTRTAKLFRREDSGGKRFRITMAGADHTRHATENVNLNLDESAINPLYALPKSLSPANQLVVRADEIVLPLVFTNKDDVLQFQQAVTGFKTWKSYWAHDVTVSFVLRSADKPIKEKACIQLWYPKQLEGSRVKNRDVNRADETMGYESMRDGVTSSITIPAATPVMETGSHNRNASGVTMSLEMAFAGPNLQRRSPMSHVYNQAKYGRTDSNSSMPVRPSVVYRPTNNANNPTHASTSRGESSATGSIRNHSSSVTTRTDEASHIISISRKPTKPQLVLFTYSLDDPVKLYTMAIEIDDDVKVKPERCDCRKDERECCIVAIEQEKRKNLAVRRWEAVGAQGVSEWDIAPLADTVASCSPRTPRGDTSWSRVKRVSITFDTPDERRRFGGLPCECRAQHDNELKWCLHEGHQGLLGEVREWHRIKYTKWLGSRFGRHQSVV